MRRFPRRSREAVHSLAASFASVRLQACAGFLEGCCERSRTRSARPLPLSGVAIGSPPPGARWTRAQDRAASHGQGSSRPPRARPGWPALRARRTTARRHGCRFGRPASSPATGSPGRSPARPRPLVDVDVVFEDAESALFGWVGSARRELLDPVIVFNEQHLCRLLRDDVAHDSAERIHTCLRDAPEGRPAEIRASPDAELVGLPRVGGLHPCSV